MYRIRKTGKRTRTVTPRFHGWFGRTQHFRHHLPASTTPLKVNITHVQKRFRTTLASRNETIICIGRLRRVTLLCDAFGRSGCPLIFDNHASWNIFGTRKSFVNCHWWKCAPLYRPQWNKGKTYLQFCGTGNFWASPSLLHDVFLET